MTPEELRAHLEELKRKQDKRQRKQDKLQRKQHKGRQKISKLSENYRVEQFVEALHDELEDFGPDDF